MVVNISSLHYATFDRGRLLLLHRQLDKYLGGRNSRNIPGLTAQLRKPELVRDMVAHWSAVNYPADGSYIIFLQDNTDWKSVQRHIELRENNPVMFL